MDQEMTDRKSEQQAQEYLEKQDACGIRKGDFVKIKRKAESFEGGWQDKWVEGMNEMIGCSGIVVSIKNTGILVIVPGVSRETMGMPLPNSFPYFVLKKLRVVEPYK